MPWTNSDKVVAVRSRSHVVDVLVETLDGWRLHLSGRNASLLSFWFFLCIFPLLLVATTILGFVLQDNQQLQQDIVNGALDDIPVLGAQLHADPTSLNGSVWVLVFGLLAALWSASKAFVGLQGALDDTWEIPVDDRPSMPVQRGKALLGMLILGGAQIAGFTIATIIEQTDLPSGSDILLFLATAVINVGGLSLAFRYLTAADVTWPQVMPGAIAGGVAFTLIQHFGTRIVRTITDRSSDTYGQFALVLGLVTWLGLLAISALMANEYNAARVRLHGGPQPAAS
jgi:membrane protein